MGVDGVVSCEQDVRWQLKPDIVCVDGQKNVVVGLRGQGTQVLKDAPDLTSRHGVAIHLGAPGSEPPVDEQWWREAIHDGGEEGLAQPGARRVGRKEEMQTGFRGGSS